MEHRVLRLSAVVYGCLTSEWSFGFPVYGSSAYAAPFLLECRTLCDRNLFSVIFQEMTRLVFLAYELCCPVQSGNDLLEFAMNSTVVVFGVLNLFDCGYIYPGPEVSIYRLQILRGVSLISPGLYAFWRLRFPMTIYGSLSNL